MGFTHEQIEEAIKVWQKRLRLQDWTFKVNWDLVPDDEDALASVCQAAGRKIANLRFSTACLEGSADEVSQTIAHELIHMIVEPLRDVVDLALTGVSSERHSLISQSMLNATELATDQLATAFAEAYKPPDCLLPAKAEQADDEFEDEPFRVTD
jgi:hypothetical protein